MTEQQTHKETEDTMTVQETALALQVSRMTVIRMLADGRLTNVAPHIPARTRQPIRIARKQVDALRPRPRDTPDPDADTTTYAVTVYTPPVVAAVERLVR